MDIKVRPIRRRCDVRNCRNTASYHISRTRELGYTVVICEDCLREALAKIEESKPIDKPVEAETAKPEEITDDTRVEITPKGETALKEAKAAKAKKTGKKVDA